jgi:hypothetical protein
LLDRRNRRRARRPIAIRRGGRKLRLGVVSQNFAHLGANPIEEFPDAARCRLVTLERGVVPGLALLLGGGLTRGYQASGKLRGYRAGDFTSTHERTHGRVVPFELFVDLMGRPIRRQDLPAARRPSSERDDEIGANMIARDCRGLELCERARLRVQNLAGRLNEIGTGGLRGHLEFPALTGEPAVP